MIRDDLIRRCDGVRHSRLTTTPSCSAVAISVMSTWVIADWGMPGYAAFSGACAKTNPPRSLTAIAPAVPSSREPDSTTAITRGPHARAALRNNTSTAGGGRLTGTATSAQLVVDDHQVTVRWAMMIWLAAALAAERRHQRLIPEGRGRAPISYSARSTRAVRRR
jgi:hypothetical protein